MNKKFVFKISFSHHSSQYISEFINIYGHIFKKYTKHKKKALHMNKLNLDHLNMYIPVRYHFNSWVKIEKV